jgi:peptidoglycan/xylan/chitin deacetylase (PgdA/CDA1 family)
VKGHSDPDDASGPLDIARMQLRQSRRDLLLKVRTRDAWALSQLDRNPDPDDPAARFLCLRIRRPGSAGLRQICFGRSPGGETRSELGYTRIEGDGSVRFQKAIDARVSRPDGRTAHARFRPRAADLGTRRYRWRLYSQWSGAECLLPLPKRTEREARRVLPPCSDRAPNAHEVRFRILPVRPVGCTRGDADLVLHGPRGRKLAALTFDDGPSDYTRRILSILDHRHAKGTFFQVGELISGRTKTSRAVIRSGNELANHSLHHEIKPSRASMAETSRRIKSATDFKPCLFRPPGGAYDWRVVSDAKSLGMTTVIWDVDPRDWSRPGSGEIYSRVVSNTKPGSIILLHDGGGDRSQTVAALPDIVRSLRARGYRLVTVTKLLGGHFKWRPVR